MREVQLHTLAIHGESLGENNLYLHSLFYTYSIAPTCKSMCLDNLAVARHAKRARAHKSPA